MSIGGLVSGLDTAGIVDQLIAVESNPQKLLMQRLSATQSQATAYRAINTRFDAVRSAAEELTKDAAWQSAKASSSSSSATATATTGAAAGSLTFDVTAVAATHSTIGSAAYTATSDPAGFAQIDVLDAAGASKGTITVGGSGTLEDAISAINASPHGLKATAVQVAPGEFKLQVVTKTSGASGIFSLTSSAADGTAGPTFAEVTKGRDAELTVGTGPGAYTVTSPTNTFSGLLAGTTITVTKPETGVTVDVAADPEAVATKVQSLVNAVNGLLDTIDSYTDATSSSAALKGDSTLRRLGTQVLDVLAYAVGSDGSASAVGLELTQGGRYTFDKTAFTDKLAADPTVVQRMFGQTAITGGADRDTATVEDNVTVPVGIAAKLLDIGKTATDSTIGTLTVLAKGADSRADDLEGRIEAWDLRLEMRRETLNRQFTAMETALSTMQSKSNWLAAQLGSLPTTQG